MDLSAIGTRLGSAALTPLVRKLLVAEGPGAGLVERPVRIAGWLSFRGEKKSLDERALHKLAAELVRRVVEPLPETDRLPAHEEAATAHALALTLHALGDLDMDDVQAVELGEEHLAQRLKQAVPPGTFLFLSESAAVLHDAVLHAACRHILHFFTQRSTFVARTLVEQTRRQGRLQSDMSTLLHRVPSLDAQDAAFEKEYAKHLVRRHSELTIYGLDLHHAREWQLNTAYISLEAETRQGPAVPVPTERILVGRDRVLLRGLAGSGKTTLLQWLAVATAREELPDELGALRGRVPFVLPLRTIARQALPRPAEFLSSVAFPLTGPDGWAERVLTAGRGLVLVDGVDEVPHDMRESARQWLHRLLAAFPKNLWLVTTRPSAVQDDWLRSDTFAELSLMPMSERDIAAFVRRWHTAAQAGSESAEALLTVIRTKPDLGHLAVNPLMCGLLCALHRERRGFLPEDRKELYDAALAMLLERRDIERGMHQRGDLRIGREPQIALLQRIAHWMVRNDRSEMDREDALAVLAQHLPSMTHIDADAETVLRYLLDRGGVLRQPTADTVDFVHRTFQDYLAAKAIVEARDFPWLQDNADNSQWEDVIRMAVAHGRPDERARILRGLVPVLGDELPDEETAPGRPQLTFHRARVTPPADPKGRRRLPLRRVLLARSCLDHAPEVDSALQRSILALAHDLLPPGNPAAARRLAEYGGPNVVSVLPGPEGLDEAQAEACVITATRLASHAAIAYLASFRTHPSLAVRRQLAWSWHRFDSAAYAEEVISHLPEDGGLYFTAASLDHLTALAAMGGRARIQILGSHHPTDLATHIPPQRLTHLWLREGYTSVFRGMNWLARFPHLRTLVLPKPPHPLDLRTIPETVRITLAEDDASEPTAR
ncbi:NACHT domain-containing protein [Streptomyces sp. RS10V-4]|uniref:NACHT domain-containing protein n=1 Tax=Streptomyces rhizoryzae TaxID=2932493 RepID=UPI0020055C06|nr:NACHT domain-containing protein [Streptomyces rhizoryzae]MCK7622369.1 NACHT domain-containing protein [Streptomyces rhizoryzae]